MSSPRSSTITCTFIPVSLKYRLYLQKSFSCSATPNFVHHIPSRAVRFSPLRKTGQTYGKYQILGQQSITDSIVSYSITDAKRILSWHDSGSEACCLMTQAAACSIYKLTDFTEKPVAQICKVE